MSTYHEFLARKNRRVDNLTELEADLTAPSLFDAEVTA